MTPKPADPSRATRDHEDTRSRSPEAVRARRVTATAVMEECLAEIATKNERVNAFVFVDEASRWRAPPRSIGV